MELSIVKMEFTGVFILSHIDCGYSFKRPQLEPPRGSSAAVLTCTHDLCFEQK